MDDNGLVSPAKILDCNQFTWNWSTCAIHRDNPCACKPVGPAFSSPSRVRDTTFEAKFSENDWRQIIRSSAVSPRKLLRTPRRPSLRSTFYLTCMPFLASTSNNFFNVCVFVYVEVCLTEREGGGRCALKYVVMNEWVCTCVAKCVMRKSVYVSKYITKYASQRECVKMCIYIYIYIEVCVVSKRKREREYEYSTCVESIWLQNIWAKEKHVCENVRVHWSML